MVNRNKIGWMAKLHWKDSKLDTVSSITKKSSKENCKLLKVSCYEIYNIIKAIAHSKEAWFGPFSYKVKAS